MRNRTMVGVGVVLAVIMFPLLAAANPGIVVVPDQYDFGEVEVGAGASTQIEIGNDWWGSLSIFSITVLPGGSDFSLINALPPGTIVHPGSSLTFGVEFSPTAEGLATVVVEIQWTNGESGTSYVELSGTGIVASGPVTIEDILAFFDAGVEAGTIEGRGHRPGQKRAHLKIFQVRLITAAIFLENGWMKGACKLLERSYAFSDDQNGPRDLIEGPAVLELNNMILELMADLGCL